VDYRSKLDQELRDIYDSFLDVLGLRTIWIPHSYAACSQHAPDEHMLGPIERSTPLEPGPKRRTLVGVRGRRDE